MDTKKLRQKILDLAIRGKLVPQDPNDEPASVLLERIRAEKERLIKEGKIKRSKKTAADEEIEAPFEIPESWEWTRLCDITSVIGDGLHGTPQYDIKGEYFFINGNNLSNRQINIKDSTKRVSQEEYEKYKKPLNDTTILVSINGTIGNVGTYNDEKVILGKSACYFNLFPFLNKEYICSIIESLYFLKYAISSATGSTIKNVPLQAINEFLIPIPPFAEQQRIVDEVECWFALIDILESNEGDLLKLIDQAKSKILDLAIHGKLVPQDPNDERAIKLLKRINPNFEPCDNIDHIPDSWINCRIQDVFKISMGSSPVGESLNRNGDGIEFHQGKLCFTELYLGLSEIYTTQSVKLASPNSILLCVRAPVGVVNITEREVCIGRGLCSLTPINAINLMYGLYALQTCQIDFEQKATGSTFKAIGGDVVKNQFIPLPPYNEQIRIVAKIEELFAVLDSIKESLE